MSQQRRNLEAEIRQVFRRTAVRVHRQWQTRSQNIDRLGRRFVARPKIVPFDIKTPPAPLRSFLPVTICSSSEFGAGRSARKPKSAALGGTVGSSRLVSTHNLAGSGCSFTHSTSGGRFCTAPPPRENNRWGNTFAGAAVQISHGDLGRPRSIWLKIPTQAPTVNQDAGTAS